MGFEEPWTHETIPEVQEGIKRVLAAAKSAGKYAGTRFYKGVSSIQTGIGMFCTSADQVRARFEQGCESWTPECHSKTLTAVLVDFMNLGADVVALGAWNTAQLSLLKNIR